MALTSAPALEPLTHKVGHISTLSIDTSRNDRVLGIDVWYPASTNSDSHTEYELIPGVKFSSASAYENSPVASGSYPLLVWSHGRTGLRHNYSLLCEALASRGYIVVAPDHPGDGLFDWFLGKNVDDVTNERLRQGDLRFCIDAAVGAVTPLIEWIPDVVNTDRIFVGGHSYGGLSALATTGSLHEFSPDERVKATVVAQGYTRTLHPEFFTTVVRPTLFVVGNADLTTPPRTDADPAWQILASRNDEVARFSRRHDLEWAPHQGCSDFALYNELAPHIDNIPDAVREYLDSIAKETPAEWLGSWRNGLQVHAEVTDNFLLSLP